MSALFSNGEMVGGSVENTDFTSSDVADGQATSWTTVTPIVDDEPNVSLFTKLSQIAKNVRYLYKMLGTTDISAIGNGTVTNAIKSIQSVECIDVTDLFTCNTNIWYLVTYNPKSQTISINASGSGNFPNGSIVFTAPSKYKHNQSSLNIGACGSANNISSGQFFNVIATLTGSTAITIWYSTANSAQLVGFSCTYKVG